MPQQSRNVLKNFFKNGSLLSQSEFSDLIDSSWNINDDGMRKTSAEGLQLAPEGTSQKILSFYESHIDDEPNWQLSINHGQTRGLGFVQPNKEDEPALFLADNTHVGIGNANPMTQLDIKGTVCSSGRVGGYKIGQVKADAEWHTILSGLKECNSFEIVAEARGNSGDGNYTMAHAIALNANQGKSGKIKVVNSSFRWFDFRDKILFRWRGNPNNYELQIRTGKHYYLNAEKKDFNYIKFHVCRLWDSNLTFENIIDHV
jgi:hypothetical protein